ncbi:MAG: hypothetical protein NTZ20_05655 [Candidatus Levybacteria bacterium]|nr:hypothetical protein [Candidatus Levybacteria bacterium]
MLAQTFYVPSPSSGVAGVYISDVLLYFSKLPTDDNIGITIRINEVENGIPTTETIPFAVCRYLRSLIKEFYPTQASLDSSSVPIGFTFGIPVFLKTQKEYAIVISADGDHPDYQLWVSELSKPDVSSGIAIAKNSSIGVLLTSSNGRTWTAYQNEDLKFVMYRANFAYNTGYVTFTNANTEFLQREIINTPKPFLRGEKMYVSNGVINSSNVLVGLTSTTVTIRPANTQYSNAANKLIYLSSNGQSQTDIRQILSIVNNVSNTVLTLNAAPSFSDTNATLGFLYSNGGLYGTEVYSNGPRDLILYNSTANSTVNFRELYIAKNTHALLIGAISGTAANLLSLGIMPYDEIVPQFAKAEPLKTELDVSFKGTSMWSNTKDTAYIPLMFDNTQKLIDTSRAVRSRSDELHFDSGDKSLEIKVGFNSETNYLTPTINDIKRSATLLHNKISRANTQLIVNETYPGGGRMGNKYISKPVLLSLEAEDLVVYLSVYRPATTEIFVYCKLLNREDPQGLKNKYWTLMREVEPRPYSSKADLNDVRELEFKLFSAEPTTISPIAFLNANNSSIARYYNEDGSYFDGYNTFSIKIVLTSTASYIVPRVADMRAIAVQI